MKYLTVLLLSCFAISVCADNLTPKTTLTFGEGYYDFASKRHVQNTNVWFGALAYRLTERFEVQGLFGQFITTSHAAVNNNQSVNGMIFAFDGFYYGPLYYSHFTPYLLVGPGLLSMNPNGTNPNTVGMVNGGGGVQAAISKNIAFRLEARDIYTIVGGTQDFFVNGSLNFVW